MLTLFYAIIDFSSILIYVSPSALHLIHANLLLCHLKEDKNKFKFLVFKEIVFLRYINLRKGKKQCKKR